MRVHAISQDPDVEMERTQEDDEVPPVGLHIKKYVGMHKNEGK